VCKRINACSSKIAHEMALIPSLEKVDEARKIMSSSTNNENEKYIIQQFVNHDGILFKIYVYDSNFKVIIRPSLNNVKTEGIIYNMIIKKKKIIIIIIIIIIVIMIIINKNK